MPTEAELEWINEDLRSLAYPIDKLELLPNNSNRGDVAATRLSLETFGQMEPIVCSLRPGTDIGVVLAGNTRLKAARLMGKAYIAVSWKKDGTEEHDLAYATADNSTGRKGELDLDIELENLRRLEHDDDLLLAAGYDLVDMDDLMTKIQSDMEASDRAVLESLDFQSEDLSVTMLPEGPSSTPSSPVPDRPPQKPVIQATIIFDTEAQQLLWQKFMKQLKRQYPVSEGYDTFADRLMMVLEEYIEDDEA